MISIGNGQLLHFHVLSQMVAIALAPWGLKLILLKVPPPKKKPHFLSAPTYQSYPSKITPLGKHVTGSHLIGILVTVGFLLKQKSIILLLIGLKHFWVPGWGDGNRPE